MILKIIYLSVLLLYFIAYLIVWIYGIRCKSNFIDEFIVLYKDEIDYEMQHAPSYLTKNGYPSYIIRFYVNYSQKDKHLEQLRQKYIYSKNYITTGIIVAPFVMILPAVVIKIFS